MTKKTVKPDVLAAYKNDNPEDWISRHFYIPETHKPMTLQPYQQQALKRALRKSDGEHFDYSVIVWSDVKKSAKSTLAAAVALWRAFQLDWAQMTSSAIS